MITHNPSSIPELQELLPQLQGVGEVSLEAVAELVEHVSEDMTATVQAGMTLAEFQSGLARSNQWLPVDPPQTEDVSIGELLAGNLNGPRRFGFGTIRDWLIGLAVVLPDGRLIRNGGKVVKNVAGFDLCRLFVGAKMNWGSLSRLHSSCCLCRKRKRTWASVANRLPKRRSCSGDLGLRPATDGARFVPNRWRFAHAGHRFCRDKRRCRGPVGHCESPWVCC